MRTLFLPAATVAAFSWDMTASAAGAMSLTFSWAGVASCSPRPPAFTLSGVPGGTSRLAFNMVDLDLTSYPHGGGTIPFQGDEVPAGSFSYTGPCPPAGQHTIDGLCRRSTPPARCSPPLLPHGHSRRAEGLSGFSPVPSAGQTPS